MIQSCSKHSTRSIDISKPVIRIIGGAFREAITILTFPAGHYSCICSLSESSDDPDDDYDYDDYLEDNGDYYHKDHDIARPEVFVIAIKALASK